jgi:DNA repair photolyase
VRRIPVLNPEQRFVATTTTYDDGEAPAAAVEVYEDASRSILSRNDSPDLGFRWSVNPYRGCLHACAYCFARPTHEYLGFGAGTDFERKLLVKRDAPALLRAAFSKRSWQREFVVFSGVTDCYQPLEREHQLTRGCLEVCRDLSNPVGVVTKGVLVARDAPLLAEVHAASEARVAISLPFLDTAHARAFEPYAPSPARRLAVIETLAKAGVPVGISIAPVVPGLNEESIPALLEAAKNAGAQGCSFTMLRLPGRAVEEVFIGRLREAVPLRAEKILARLQEMAGEGWAPGAEETGPRIYNSSFHARQRGSGVYAQLIEAIFLKTARRLGLLPFSEWPLPAAQDGAQADGDPPSRSDHFLVPRRSQPGAPRAAEPPKLPPNAQLSLFGVDGRQRTGR